MFPDLFASNPASHLIWVIAGLIFAVLGVILLVELADWLRSLLGRLRNGVADADEGDGERWTFHEPDSELRQRVYHRVEPYRRTWHEGRPKEPNERDG